MATHIVIYGLHNRGDNMTLREVITEKRKELWRDSDLTEMGEAQELIIDRIDGMGDRICELESEIVNLNTCMHNLEPFHSTAGVIKITSAPDPEPQEPFPGYNELIKEAIPVIRATIDEKKQKLAKREHPEE
jgi:hypothetical protein